MATKINFTIKKVNIDIKIWKSLLWKHYVL